LVGIGLTYLQKNYGDASARVANVVAHHDVLSMHVTSFTLKMFVRPTHTYVFKFLHTDLRQQSVYLLKLGPFEIFWVACMVFRVTSLEQLSVAEFSGE
jgi:hypothetical protein